jgi:hypothetical protein
MQSLRLQMLMDQLTKFDATLSNIFKTVASSDDTIVQNLQ